MRRGVWYDEMFRIQSTTSEHVRDGMLTARPLSRDVIYRNLRSLFECARE